MSRHLLPFAMFWLAGCAGSGGDGSAAGPHVYCTGLSPGGAEPTLVISEVRPLPADPASRSAAALASSFAAYVGKTWAGLSITPARHIAGSAAEASAARGQEEGQYEGRGYAIMRASYWDPA